jgi:hypothetical protein
MHNIAILFTLSKTVTHGSEYHLKCRIYVVRAKIYVNKFAIFYRLTPTGSLPTDETFKHSVLS